MTNEHILKIVLIILIIVIVYLLYIYNKNKCKCSGHRNLLRMTQLWVDHLFYTRLVVEAFLQNNASLPSLKQRLLQNQKDIGNEFTCLYGPQVGNTVTKLLTEHILDAVQVLDAIKTKNSAAQTEALKKFYANANEIGRTLDQLKGTNGIFAHHMKMHIDTLVESVTAYNKKNYKEDISASNKYLGAGIKMAFDIITM